MLLWCVLLEIFHYELLCKIDICFSLDNLTYVFKIVFITYLNVRKLKCFITKRGGFKLSNLKKKVMPTTGSSNSSSGGSGMNWLHKIKTNTKYIYTFTQNKITNKNCFNKFANLRYLLRWWTPWDIIIDFIITFVTLVAVIVTGYTKRGWSEHVRHR